MSSPGPYIKRPCRWCEREVGINKLPTHEGKCLGNPDVAVAVLQFIVDWSPPGRVMSVEEFERSPHRGDLPSAWMVRDYFGGWRAFAEWCGRSIMKPNRPKYYDYIPGLDDPHPLITEIRDRMEEERRGGGGMPAEPALRCIRAWNPRTHNYEPVGWQPVALLR